jgi:glucose/arabinose dehydrogenase
MRIAALATTVTVLLTAVPCVADDAAKAPPAAPAAPATPAAQTARPRVAPSRIWPALKLSRPVQMIQVPDQEDRWFIAEQSGVIKTASMKDTDTSDAPVVVDLRERVNDGSNEEGLLSIAFHPDYPTKRELYVYYSANPPRRSVLSRFTVAADGKTIDPASEEVILEVPQPYWNHNGGTVLFGPDGYLYLSLGDGGAAGDPLDAGQDLSKLLAKIIRIDVNKTSDGKKYAIPADNPFVGKEGAAPEVWAYGLRNVWRMSFDKETGQLWAGDVGQNEWEEVHLITKGGNYGWRVREGTHNFGETKHTTEGPMIDPIVEYPHKQGLSITGGYVYRGDAIPALKGMYLYADFVSGAVWAIRPPADGKSPATPMQLFKKGGSLWSSFAQAKDGTLYLLSFEGGQSPGQAGAVWRIVSTD